MLEILLERAWGRITLATFYGETVGISVGDIKWSLKSQNTIAHPN
jgi:hypothetical protein